MIRTPCTRAFALLVTSTFLASCGGEDERPQPTETAGKAPSNRVDVPPMVRRNLGIEFATVARRRVAQTLRLPAQVELLPAATQHYTAPFAGRVQVLVAPLQQVEAGDVLYTLDSHEWRATQRELGALATAIELTGARIDAMGPLLESCAEHERSLRTAHDVTGRYIEDLQRAEGDVGGQAQKLAAARVELAQLAAQIADADEKHTETVTRQKELDATLRSQREQLELLQQGAAAALGVPAESLAAGWRGLSRIEVRAQRTGVVDEIRVANGALVESFGHVLSTIDPTAVRCHARALQSDLGLLRNGLPAAIVPTGTGEAGQRVAGTLQLGPAGDARARTLDVYVAPEGGDLGFVRAGLAVFVEITTATSGDAPLAIPRACVLPDGLDRVFFRRDPRDPDKVIRVVADLGVDDGVWVEVKSGLTDGDEVVQAGAYELVLASGDQTPKGGHFHADGTWHEDH
jgi:multidrug resistance efflux pump